VNRGVPAAHFKWHTAPVTSVAWHPTEESVLAVAGADDQITVWDLSLEQVIGFARLFLRERGKDEGGFGCDRFAL